MINSGTQPIQNLSVMNYHSSDPKEKAAWSRHFIDKGLKGMIATNWLQIRGLIHKFILFENIIVG